MSHVPKHARMLLFISLLAACSNFGTTTYEFHLKAPEDAAYTMDVEEYTIEKVDGFLLDYYESTAECTTMGALSVSGGTTNARVHMVLEFEGTMDQSYAFDRTFRNTLAVTIDTAGAVYDAVSGSVTVSDKTPADGDSLTLVFTDVEMSERNGSHSWKFSSSFTADVSIGCNKLTETEPDCLWATDKASYAAGFCAGA